MSLDGDPDAATPSIHLNSWQYSSHMVSYRLLGLWAVPAFGLNTPNITSSSCYIMTRGNSWVEREYGKRLVKNRFLFTVFAIVFTAVAVCLLLPLLIANNDTLLAKTGTAASITGVFIGTYIATWLINQNRTKNITENYFYKVGILTSTIEMLNGAILFIEKTKSEYTKHQIDEYHVEEYPEVVPKFF